MVVVVVVTSVVVDDDDEALDLFDYGRSVVGFGVAVAWTGSGIALVEAVDTGEKKASFQE